MLIQAKKNKRGKWYWRILAKNNRILAHSESYSTKDACIKTVYKVYFAKLTLDIVEE